MTPPCKTVARCRLCGVTHHNSASGRFMHYTGHVHQGLMGMDGTAFWLTAEGHEIRRIRLAAEADTQPALAGRVERGAEADPGVAPSGDRQPCPVDSTKP